MKPKSPLAKFVTAEDLPDLVAAAVRQLKGLNPHPDDCCIGGISVENLELLPIELIRTKGQQSDTGDDSLDAIAEEERAKGAAAAAIANKLGMSGSSLAGEIYVAEISKSPDSQLTRDAIKTIRKPAPAIALGPGVSLGQGVQGFPHEIPCDANQVLKVAIGSVSSKPYRAIAQVVDAREHQSFWSYFDDRSFEIEIVDEIDARTLRLAAAIEMELEVEIAPTILLPKGVLKHDRVRAGLCGQLDHEGVASAVIRLLTQQLSLGF